MKKGQKKSKFEKDLLHTKVGKYFLAVRKGKTKTEAAISAGYADTNHMTQIERTKDFQALQTKFGTSLIQKITIDEINDALVDNIKQEGQDRVDRNARNRAIEIAKEMIEPSNSFGGDESESKVLIVLSK